MLSEIKVRSDEYDLATYPPPPSYLSEDQRVMQLMNPKLMYFDIIMTVHRMINKYS